MISTITNPAVTDLGRAATSACPVLAPAPVWVLGGELCPQHDERFTGLPVTPTSVRRRIDVAGYVPAMKIKFVDVQSYSGSPVRRPPA